MSEECTADRNVSNCNDRIANWDTKQSRRESYIENGKHKAKSQRAYYLYAEWESTNQKDTTLLGFNFKKTTGKKKKYSCGGYGGKCSMCSSVYNDGKLRKKIEIQKKGP